MARSFQHANSLADDLGEIGPVVVGRRGVTRAALSRCSHDTGEHGNQDAAFLCYLPLCCLIELATRFRVQGCRRLVQQGIIII